jgi:SsrA-binding protein
MAKEAQPADEKVVVSHRKARHLYEILDRIEAGIALRGPEVKSLRAGQADLSDSYARVRGGEVWLVGAQISPYAQAGRENLEPKRERRLLLHKAEIHRLEGRVAEKGLTLVPLRIYFRGGRAKVELALARGKRSYDRRESIRRREDERSMRRALRRGRAR